MSDDEQTVKKPVAKQPKKVVESDDDEQVVRKPPTLLKPVPKKAPAGADSDDEVAVKKPVAKRAAKAADSDDDEPVKKPVARKPAPKAADNSESDDDVAVVKPKHADPNAGSESDDTESDSGDDVDEYLVDLIDYDAMTEELFAAHLNSQSKQERLAEKQAIRDREAEALATSDEGDRHFDGTLAYTYKFMLHRVLAVCRKNNPELASSDTINLPAPKIEKSGSKKTALTNFRQICVALNRSQDEVKDYIEKSLTTQGSIDGNHCLILKYQNAKLTTFQALLTKYVQEYVKCSACGRIQTELVKDATSRLLVMHCKDCKAQRYIQAAGSATFRAQTTKRSKLRSNMV